MTVSVCVINAKGGCGKTTTATHLVAGLSAFGLRTLLVDLDRYRGATLWHAQRHRAASPVELADWRKKFGAVPDGIQRVVIDCPASLGSGTIRDIVRESDLLVVPVLPSIFDRYATELFLDKVTEIKKVRTGRKPILVLSNRYREKSIASQELETFLESIDHAPVARISERSAYPRLANDGLTVFDRDTAALRALQEEWMPLLWAVEQRAHLRVIERRSRSRGVDRGVPPKAISFG